MASPLTPARLTITEYGEPRHLAQDAHSIGLETAALRALLEEARDRLVSTLAVEPPILFQGAFWKVQDMAGLLRLSPRLELEIVPKFLNADDPTWREDFFVLATLVRFGRILPREALRSSPGERGNLADLIAHAVVEMYNRNRGRPLWVYRRRTWHSFEVTGELEPESVLLPDDEGFEQSESVLDRQNPYNWVIHAAMEMLLPEVRNGDLRRRLSECKSHLAPQCERPRGPRPRVLPSRHRRWQNLYDLAGVVLDGFGLALTPGTALAPGYVLKTADAWESLVLLALRSGFPDCQVSKTAHPLGKRVRLDMPKATPRGADVTPDATITFPNGLQLPCDAKYKGRIDGGLSKLTVSASDLYEALAFMGALKCARIVLIYPRPGAERMDAGHTAEFEHVLIENKTVVGLAVEVRGLAKEDGFHHFAQGLAQGCQKALFPLD